MSTSVDQGRLHYKARVAKLVIVAERWPRNAIELDQDLPISN